MRQSGMTLFEILAVLVIVGMLGTVLMVGIGGRLSESKHQICSIQMNKIVECIELYKSKTRSLPPSGNGIETLGSPKASPQDPYYLEPSQMLDPWGNSFILLVPGPSGQAYEVRSYGADGVAGGEGENADLSSAQTQQP